MKNNLIRKLYTIIKTAALLPIYKSYVRPHLDYYHQTFVLMNLRLQDVLIKTNIFSLVIRLQDVLVKTNIFVLAIRLEDVFKTFSRRLAKASSRLLQDVFKTSCKDIFNMFPRPIIKFNCSC